MRQTAYTALLLLALIVQMATTQANENISSALSATELQAALDTANLEPNQDERLKTLESLAAKSEQSLLARPNDLEIQIVSGFINANFADAKGGIGALKYAKKARAQLENSIAADPQALKGSAHTGLGSIYFKVPGWPVAFGNKKKANSYFLKSLEINPNGIDANYYYAEFLFGAKKYAEAKARLETALAASIRPGREAIDTAKKKTIKRIIADINKKL